MRVVTNPGSNLGAELVARYGIDLTPQKIVVDKREHDTRSYIDLSTVDEWVRGAKEHPYVLGTSAAEFAKAFKQIAADDREVVAVMTSRKLIQSYDAACSAARTLAELQGPDTLDVRVIDTGVTDGGAGLVTIYAALARDAGLSLDEIDKATRAFAAGMQLRLWLATLDNLIKGGRASFLRGFLANLLRVRPVLHFVDGELQVAHKISSRSDPVDHLTSALAETHAGRRVWMAISHGGDEAQARRLAEQLATRMTVDYLTIQPFSASIYLHVGPGALGAFTAPVDDLPWAPPPPPPG